MSKFLGFVHYLMYDKIHFLDKLTEDIIEKANVDRKRIDEILNKHGRVHHEKLEEVIDENNIHNWLNAEVIRVEKRFAELIFYLEKNKILNIDEIKEFLYQYGKSFDFKGTLQEGFNEILSKFLDGMPCDRALSIISSSENKIQVEVVKDVHKKIWKDFLGVETYWTLRNEFVRGFFSNKNTNISVFKNGFILEEV